MNTVARYPEPYVPAVWRVEERRWETANTVTFALSPPPQGFTESFAPGQFNMLYTFGVGEVPISISGDPASPATMVHTIRAVGSVTRILAGLEPGSAIGLRGPYGSAWPLEDARGRDLILLAGGLGLAPLRPAICHALANRGAYRRLVIICGTRSPENLVFRDELEGWTGMRGVQCLVTVDHASPDWPGHVGTILQQIRRAEFDPDNAMACVCGPEIMMRHSAEALIGLGMPANAIHLSLERNMKCAVSRCGHCQFGPHFLCGEGPVFRYDRIAPLLGVAEV